ncbi:VOC family protein [Listeria booriae]|uniref:VOC family protein n=1 Tax=Listeria booriae TaxID=1552123 RepID=A0A841Y502_9LIST|nr:VOC family protein [Listeria booriae]MBC1372693.1 VOC family protein [Listeria booriae]
MAKTISYLTFSGNANEAIDFYQAAFDVEVTMRNLYKMLPNFSGDETHGELVAHARLAKDEVELFYVSDAPNDEVVSGDQVSVTYFVDSKEALEKAFTSLSKNGVVKMEIQETGWGVSYAEVTDQFGVNWKLNFQKDA